MPITRRGFLAATGFSAAAAALAACGSDGGASSSSTPSGQLEVFSWWTAGGEKDALSALVGDFSLRHPTVRFVNRAVAGGAGTAAKTELARRLKAGNPPDTFQGQIGGALHGYVEAGQLEAVDFLYRQQGWEKSFNPKLLPMLRKGGSYYGVPVDIHHVNMLWSNQKVCDNLGISSSPSTVREFLDNLKTVQSAGGIIPLATSEEWSFKQVFETLLLSVLGPDTYTALWQPGGNFGSSGVKQAVSYFAELLPYCSSLDGSLTWDQATQKLGKGQACYQIMGDWAEANLKAGSLYLTPRKDYNWAPVPGTSGIFEFEADCFTLPKGAQNRDAAVAWLTECGSLRGQDDFDTVKGAIPPRASVDASERTLYDEYQKWSLDQWQAKSTRLVGSVTHGTLVTNDWNTAIDTAVTAFLKDRKEHAFQEALAAASQKYAFHG
jgi:glucose/mannose transport system substrate-binding protein